MSQPRIIDNDRGVITASVNGHRVRDWIYANDEQRRHYMVLAREYVEGWGDALASIKERLDTRLNNVLCEMKPDYDDSIVGFNEAWDVMRNTLSPPPAHD